MEQLAIGCKFFYVTIVSTNSSKCRFFTVFEVQLILMYYFCVSCVFSVYFIFRFYGSYECHALTFLSSFYLTLLSTCILLSANKHGWMDPPFLKPCRVPISFRKFLSLVFCRRTSSTLLNHASYFIRIFSSLLNP